MDRSANLETENKTAPVRGLEASALSMTPGAPAPPAAQGASPGRGIPSQIKVGKHLVMVEDKEIEVFTMALGTEQIELLPHKNWSQLDTYKWRVRGKLPGTPAGLEIALDHIKLVGERVSPKEPDACAKLEHLFEQWLAVEREGAELARRKAQARAAVAMAAPQAAPDSQTRHFEVEVDKEQQVHVHCLQGKEKLATIGLTPAGFQSLVNQGLLRKPHGLRAGALHDWVELDGVLFSFEKGQNDAARLAQVLNEHFLPAVAIGQGKEVVVFANAASSTGFDIQFPAKAGGVLENRRRQLDEAALELLQDPNRCGLLHNSVVLKLTRPNLIFKRKTPDGGERNLEQGPETLVRIAGDDGEERLIDLSRPVNYLHLNAVDLTAVFNHQAINRQAKTEATAPPPAPAAKPSARQTTAPTPEAARIVAPSPAPSSQTGKPKQPAAAAASRPVTSAPPVQVQTTPGEINTAPAGVSMPNRWLKPFLTAQPIRNDWLTCLIYSRVATRVGNSHERQLFGERCWVVCLSDVTDPTEPAFKAIFLTEKGEFGFFHGGLILRFESGAVWLGREANSAKGEPVRLVALGQDGRGHFVFIISDEPQPRFTAADAVLQAELTRLKEAGALVWRVKEALDNPDVMETVWTAPAEQPNPTDPQAFEHRKRG